MIKYEKHIDERHVIRVYHTYSLAIATIIDVDGTLRDVIIGDSERPENAAIDYKIDATSNEIKLFRKETNLFEEGDLVEVKKGRKYPKGLKGYFVGEHMFEIKELYRFGNIPYAFVQTDTEIIHIAKENLGLV